MAAASRTKKERGDYTIGWICTLSKELTAATAILDDIHANLPRLGDDINAYTLGSIGGHNIVVASLPLRRVGNVSAATVATHLANTFSSVKFILLVGIGGGVPPNVRLGDVVVSSPTGKFSGVVQWDFGKAEKGGTFEPIGSLNHPPNLLLAALNKLETEHEINGSQVGNYLEQMGRRYPNLALKYLRSDSLKDELFRATYNHVDKSSKIATDEDEEDEEDEEEEEKEDRGCSRCDKSQILSRKPRDMKIHYGLIASGNQVVKDAILRRKLNRYFDGQVLCIETEAAGIMFDLPCLVIRGICDYADSHKNDDWQEHAAAVAAAFAKELMMSLQLEEVKVEQPVKEVLAQLNQKVDNMHDDVRRFISADKLKRIKDWLSPVDTHTNHKKASDAFRKYHKESGTWLLTSKVFETWEKQQNSFMWLHGIPGCGKTVLSSIAIEHLLSRQHVNVVYFYFDFATAQKQTFESMIRTLVWQLLSKCTKTLPFLNQLYSSCKDGLEQPRCEQLCEVFASMMDEAKELWIVVDALDETRKEVENEKDEVLEWIKDTLCGPKDYNVHLMMTSRSDTLDESRIASLSENSYTIPIKSDFVARDISAYVRQRTEHDRRLQRWRSRPDIQDEIVQTVLEQAEGMFRLAACQLDALGNCLESENLRKTLKSLPKDLDSTYTRILEDIPDERKDNAIKILQFLIYSERPLRAEEAVDAIAVKTSKGKYFDPEDRMPDTTEIFVYCSSLVTKTYRETSQEEATDQTVEIQLAHSTVKEYLLSSKCLDIIRPNFREVQAKASMGKICLAYLVDMDVDLSNEVIVKEFPFIGYCAMNWTTLAKMAEDQDRRLQELITEFFNTGDTYRKCYNFWQAGRLPNGGIWARKNEISALYYASLAGLTKTAEKLMAEDPTISLKGGEYGSALHAASYKDHIDIMHLLLVNGADIDARSEEFGTALHIACLEGHTNSVRLLLENDANPNAQDGFRNTALQKASHEGHISIVKMLINESTNIDLDASDGFYGAAIQAASFQNHFDIVQILLRNKAEVNVRSERYDTALHAASVRGHTKIVNLLLENGADIGIQGRRYGTVLQAASAGGHCTNVEVLLKKGADVNVQGGFYGTALHAASFRGYADIVRVLIENNADIDAQNESYDTLLHSAALYGTAVYAASHEGHEETVKLLLENNADVNAHSSKSSTPLQAASRRGHVKTVELLIENNADINAQNGAYGSAIYEASEQGYIDVVELLLSKNADVNAESGFYGTALQAAAYEGHTRIVELLLDNIANINRQTGAYRTALHAAVYRGHVETARLLLSRNADINIRDQEHGTPIYTACNEGHIKIVEMLLDHKDANIQSPGNRYDNLLQAASSRGYIEIVELLLRRGFDINASGRRRGTALYAASEKGHVHIVELLLNKGAGTITPNTRHWLLSKIGASNSDPRNEALKVAFYHNYNQITDLLLSQGVKVDVLIWQGDATATLYRASAKGHGKVVELLLQRGIQANTQDFGQGNALHAAIKGNHVKIVAMLLDNGADVMAPSKEFSSGGFFTPGDTFYFVDNSPVLDPNDGNALQAASYRGLTDIVQLLLLNQNIKINAKGGHWGTALHAASSQGHFKIVELLVGQGADVNIQNGFLGNALQAACYSKSIRTINILLRNGADVNAQSGLFDNALQLASISNCIDIVKLLLDNGANVDVKNRSNNSALWEASSRGYPEVVKLLLSRGANINTRGKDESTALHAAIDRNLCGLEGFRLLRLNIDQDNLQTIKLLLKSGADINAWCMQHGTPLEAAQRHGNVEIIGMLHRENAKVSSNQLLKSNIS